MNRDDVVLRAEQWAKEALGGDASGHDWWHVERVRRMALRLGAETGADLRVCELAALLHDIADEKLCGDERAGLGKLREWLDGQDVPSEEAAHIVEIVGTMSFKGGGRAGMRTLEGKVVQDADRLDALGAVGIARTFAYSGWKGQPMHDPGLPPRTLMTPEQYRHGKSTAYNHFYEKLLTLKEKMNTDAARRLAEVRHRHMEQYLEQFRREWEGIE